MNMPVPDPTTLTLVVPCYNEARRLDRAAFEQALTSLGWLNVTFVDDGSTDGTGALLAALRASYPHRIDVITLTRNVGKAEAVRQGLRHAADRSTLVGFWDADLATPLAECATLRAVLDQGLSADWVFGIRLRSLGRQITRRPLRHYLGRLFATVTSLMLGIDSYDTQCGAKLFRVTPLLLAVLAEPFRSRWIFDVEMIVRADALLQTGFATGPRSVEELVYEHPLAVWQHQAGSKVKPTDFLRALRELLLVRNDRARWMTASVPHSPDGGASSTG